MEKGDYSEETKTRSSSIVSNVFVRPQSAMLENILRGKVEFIPRGAPGVHEISRPQKFPLLTKFSTAARWHGSTTRKKVFVENTNVTLDDTTTRAMDPVVAEAPVLKKFRMQMD